MHLLLNLLTSNSGHLLMLLNPLEDGVIGLHKLSHSETIGVNHSVLLVTREQQDSMVCHKSGHTNKCALLLIPKQQVMLVIHHTLLLILLEPPLKMHLILHHGCLLPLSHYGLLEIWHQVLLQLLNYG